MESSIPPVPYLSSSQIEAAANVFLEGFYPEEGLSTPIDEIVELRLGLSIIPVPGYSRTFGIDGFITADFEEVRVDWDLFQAGGGRYRFTLAHEAGHYWLHREHFREIRLEDIDDFLEYRASLDDLSRMRLEYQVNEFAACILALREKLRVQFLDVVRTMLVPSGYDIHRPIGEFIPYVAIELASRFDVSQQMMEIRLQRVEAEEWLIDLDIP
jgi:hypothetical protein